MKFSIITPTYKRQVELERCIKSVLEQSYKNWEMIVVDDSGEPSHTLTSPSLTLAKTGTEQKVKYFVNEKNMGNNFSKNFAFAKISEDSDYIIFLDDDDWLSGNALFELNEYLEKYKIENNKNIEWLITERVQMGENLAKPNFHPNHQEKKLKLLFRISSFEKNKRR
jgi:glycosyltransferase involved in cell wall biosynthesis